MCDYKTIVLERLTEHDRLEVSEHKCDDGRNVFDVTVLFFDVGACESKQFSSYGTSMSEAFARLCVSEDFKQQLRKRQKKSASRQTMDVAKIARKGTRVSSMNIVSQH